MKADNINILSNKKDKAHIRLEFVHKNVKGVAFRRLQPSPSQQLILECDGATKTFDRDAEITLELEKLLGINQKMLLDYVFVQQWGIFKFIDQQPAVRARAMAELFGADRAEAIYKELGDLKIDIPTPAIDAEAVRRRVEDNEAVLLGINTQLKDLTDIPDQLDAALTPLRNIVSRYERHKKLVEDVKSMTDNTSAKQKQIVALEFEINPLLEQHKELDEALKAAEVCAEEAKKGLEQWRLYEHSHHQFTTLTHSLNCARNELHNLVSNVPPKPDKYLADQEKRNAIDAMAEHSAEIRAKKAILETFKAGDKLACPTCGTPAAALAASHATYAEHIKLLSAKVAEIKDLLQINEDYTLEMAAHCAKKQRLADKCGLFSDQLQNLKMVDKPAQDRKTYESVLLNYNDTQAKFKYLSETLDIGQDKVSDLQSQINAILALRDKYQREAESLADATFELAFEATKQIDDISKKHHEREMLRHRKRDLERMINDDKKSLEKCALVLHRAERIRQAGDHLNEVRGIYKQLITMIPQHNMEDLRSEVNNNLDRFNTRFRVAAIDDLRFLLRYHSGRVQPAERLSGGERVMLALAFRIAVNSRYAEELGLLCLDEPTAGLDEDNLSCLEVALGRLRELSQACGLQVIMVTHDSGLNGLFDRVIRLEAAS